MAQRNLLPFILLGLIEQSPKTGYDLKKEFETEIGEFWSVKHSQIYSELKRLVASEQIVSETGYFGNKIEKTYYKITNKGKETLETWKYSYDKQLVVNKDEFVLKLYFIKDKNDPRLKDLLNEQLLLHKNKLNHLNERMKKLFSDTKEIDDNYGHYLILDHAIRRENEYASWLEEAIGFLAK
ncbi:PadR family transcriptional regulator [Kandleria vitulina DSM 20405]|uniref:PadR family transcriptional regulator n=1 Tax=Kandleria vitulina DSM 20405 TaxID=1410657 RepID=A0A0R2H7R9_9FIRM|nr:PadR family transcriptional regulator [Kandleria vitulina]KRN45668.1 PadR family transcriptional regulator [Kandleria vitulina DSM 20405]SDM11721.1 transcriptional regulator, PadR family [Kandleria vitulina]HAH76255.1 PadR family transcriptional regulator [Kandleria vitulina]